jgi:hypothetical protein
MSSNNTPTKTIEFVKNLLSQLESVHYGKNAIQNLNLGELGTGSTAFNTLKTQFEDLDISSELEIKDLEKKIKQQRKDIKDLETKHSNITDLIGGKKAGEEGSLATKILENLLQEIENLSTKRDTVLKELDHLKNSENKKTSEHKTKIETLEAKYESKITELNKIYQEKEINLKSKFENLNIENQNKINLSTQKAEIEIKTAENEANRKVKLINQFKDFLEETNKNMSIYSYTILGILVAAIVAIGLSIPDLLKAFNSYDIFIKTGGTNITNWQIINYAFGLLIVKLPWALFVSAVLTGMYSLLKGLLFTYEKINQDKRNMSAIYSISGNVAQSLNEYGILIVEDTEDSETGEVTLTIKVSKKELAQKKENLRWNQIMRYFEGMQQKQIEPTEETDNSKLELVTNLLNKVIDKLPKS